MAKKHKSIDFRKIKTVSLKERKNKVKMENFAKVCSKGGGFKEFLDSLPKILTGNDIRDVLNSIGRAYQTKKIILFSLGAHVIKCGLNPVIIDLIHKRVIDGLALNGAGLIHDVEIALIGATSENVNSGLANGTFGMARETAELINKAVSEAGQKNKGIGEVVGDKLLTLKAPNNSVSIVAQARALDIPITIHPAIGTDIVHQHPGVDSQAWGKAGFSDFRLFIKLVSQLEGGVFINVGSAVIMPEVFLKALTVARNLKFKVKKFTTVNMDQIEHYRSKMNIVKRPTELGGQGYYLIGRHEVMVPFLARAIKEELDL